MEHAPGHGVSAPGRLSPLQEESLTDVPFINVSQSADRMAPIRTSLNVSALVA